MLDCTVSWTRVRRAGSRFVCTTQMIARPFCVFVYSRIEQARARFDMTRPIVRLGCQGAFPGMQGAAAHKQIQLHT